MLAPGPGPHHGPGPGANTDRATPPRNRRTFADTSALDRAGEGYFAWLDHIWSAAGCQHPVRLHGDLRVIDPRTGELLRAATTDDMPDGLIYKACGNRRTTVCPSCAETYRRDAYHVIRSGLVGGKGIPERVAAHPAVFATFTAPSFGPVHTRVIRLHTCGDRTRCTCRAEPCHARRDAGTCLHGSPDVCFTRHRAKDAQLGQPLCPDCYDYAAHVVWNNSAGELWRRTKQNIERRLNQLIRARYAPGPPPHRYPRVRVSHGKAAEYQLRGAVHFHALLRLDGIDPADGTALIPPPSRVTVADLDDAIRYAATRTRYRTSPHGKNSGGWLNAWGSELDVRVVTLRGNTVTDSMVAGYLAKYATKGTEITGHNSGRINSETIDLYAAADGNHAERLIHTCWALGSHPDYRSLRRWAHMLGFGGHFLTKGHHYSITFASIRGARIYYRRTETTGTEHGPIRTADHVVKETTLIIGNLFYAGSGWKTTGDALLANTAADQARRRREAGRDDLAHEQGSTGYAFGQAA
jgi:hypothetical protein